MEIDNEIFKKLFIKTIGEGKIYFFHENINLGGGKGTENHPHICIKVKEQMLILTVVSSQVDTTREQMLKRHIVSEEEVPIIIKTDENKMTKEKSYVECNNAYMCDIEDFTKALTAHKITDTMGVLSEDDLKSVINGVLISEQVTEEIKDLLK